MTYQEFRLTPSQSYVSVSLDFSAVAVVINNPTASPVFIRTGAPDIPDVSNANIIVPAAGSRSMAVLGHAFGLALSSPSLVTGSGILSGLFQTCVVTFLSQGEIVPTFGSDTFLSLSLSDLTNGFLTAAGGSTTSPIFDLSPWGGALLYALPAAGSGQATVNVQTSYDQVVWRTMGEYALWPNVPVLLIVPRVSRYTRFVFGATSIAGEPAVSLAYTVRATLAEVLSENYAMLGASITKNYGIAALGTMTYDFATVGLPSVSIGLNTTSGHNAELIASVSQSAAGPWRVATLHEQNMSPGGRGDTLYRSVGNLDRFLRVSILETSNVALNGTLTMQIPPAPDLTAIMSNIYNALGDVSGPTNANQNIFYLLQHIETWTGQTSVSVASIDTKMSTVITSLATINTSIGTLHTDLANVISNTNGLSTSFVRSTSPTFINNQINPVTPGTFLQCGLVFVPGFFIARVVATVVSGTPPASPAGIYSLDMAIGTVAASSTIFYTGYAYMSAAGTLMQCPTMDYTSNRSPGYQIPAGFQYIWVRTSMNAVGIAAPFVFSTITQVT